MIEHQNEWSSFLSILFNAMCNVALTARVTLAEGGVGVGVEASYMVNLHMVFRRLKCNCVVPPSEGWAGAVIRDQEEAWSAVSTSGYYPMLKGQQELAHHQGCRNDWGLLHRPKRGRKSAAWRRCIASLVFLWSLSWEHMTSLLSIWQQWKIEEKTYMFTYSSKNIFWRRQFKKSWDKIKGQVFIVSHTSLSHLHLTG